MIEPKQNWKAKDLDFSFSCCYSLLNKLWCQKHYYFPSSRDILTIMRRIKAFWWLSRLVKQWNCKGIEQVDFFVVSTAWLLCVPKDLSEIIASSRQCHQPGPDEKQRPTWDVTAPINCLNYKENPKWLFEGVGLELIKQQFYSEPL